MIRSERSNTVNHRSTYQTSDYDIYEELMDFNGPSPLRLLDYVWMVHCASGPLEIRHTSEKPSPGPEEVEASG